MHNGGMENETASAASSTARETYSAIEVIPAMKARHLYSEYASALQALANNEADLDRHDSGKLTARTREQIVKWRDHFATVLNNLTRDHMPSGGGIDNGTTFDADVSRTSKLVFHISFHHMNDGGYYDGWTDHTITVTPTFGGIALHVSGRNRNDIKDYIHETFDIALSQRVIWDANSERYVLAPMHGHGNGC